MITRLKHCILFSLVIIFFSCNSDNNQTTIPVTTVPTNLLTDDELLETLQQQTFKYFWDFSEVNSGLARERYHTDNPSQDQNVVTSGGSGFGLMAILVGIERGFITRSEALNRLNQSITFLETADRFHGAWSHWISGNTGSVIPFSPLDNGGDLVETAFLAQGLICVREYFKDGTTEEQELAQRIDTLWRDIEWNWYTNGEDVLHWHWSPSNNFQINHELKGYDETLITYVLAAASPTFPINNSTYHNGWARSGNIVSSNTKYGFPLELNHNVGGSFGGPLFWAHYSYLGLNPNGLSDQYADYWQLNVSHSKINYQYCVENPNNYSGYNTFVWGLTASYSRNSDGTAGYNAHSPTNDTGVISPTAAVSSIVYTPEESLRAIRYFYEDLNGLLWGPAGFYDAFSIHHNNWVTPRYLAIDQGPMIVMIENYRTGLLWDLFMQAPEIQTGLTNLGFSSPNIN